MFTAIRLFLLACLNAVMPGVISHTWTTTVKVPGLPTLPTDAPAVITGDYCIEVEKTLNAGDTNVEVDVGTIDKTKIVSLIMNADKAAMTVYTNASDGTGGQTVALAAGKSYDWNNQMINACPITNSISKFFLNNPGAVASTFRASFLMSV